MKGSAFLGQFVKAGIVLLLFVTGSLIARAQSGGPVGPPVTPFHVDITTPVNGQAFAIGSDIKISATASNSASFINYMALYSGSNLLTARVIDPIVGQTNNYWMTLTFDWTNVSAGDYSLTAVAHNTAGISVTSPPVNITVGLIGTSVPIVNIIATDPVAVEPGTNRIYFTPASTFANYCGGTNTATFLVRRFSASPIAAGATIGVTNSDLTVYYKIFGTASNGVDYVTLPGFVTIPAGKTFALITINPLEDNDPPGTPPFSTVILSLYVPPVSTSTPPPYIVGWPSKAGAIILEEDLYPVGPPIGPVGPPIVGGPFPCGPFHIGYRATNGMNYCIEVSSNLIDWIPVCTNTVVKNSIHFIDPESCNFSSRYYRAVRASGTPLY